jgi:mono/diheme cytochrome c family protein
MCGWKGRPVNRLLGTGAALLLAAGGWGVANAQMFANYKDYTGQELFMRFCAACHGEGGHGDGPVAGTLSVLVPDLTRLGQRRNNTFPAAEVRDIIDGRSLVIAHGPRVMPVWGYEFWVEEGQDVVAEEEARDLINRLVEYLRTIQVEPPAPTVPR